MAGIFITGTDTEIGKTYVSCLLMRSLIEEGYRVAGMKPVASGATLQDGILKNEDALSLMAASNIETEYQTVNSYVFEPAISPHLAAAKAGIEIDCKNIKINFDKLVNQSDVVIVEGVGGWYAPLTMQTTVADMAKELNIPIIIVVGLRLGCLNHALLTLQAIKQTGLTISGWVANHVSENFLSADENIETLKHFFNDIPLIANIPYQSASGATAKQDHVNKQMLIDKLKLK